MKYYINKKTNRLHINGFCHFSKELPFDVEFFDSEESAAMSVGNTYSVCKLCQNKRERWLDEIKKL